MECARWLVWEADPWLGRLPPFQLHSSQVPGNKPGATVRPQAGRAHHQLQCPPFPGFQRVPNSSAPM